MAQQASAIEELIRQSASMADQFTAAFECFERMGVTDELSSLKESQASLTKALLNLRDIIEHKDYSNDPSLTLGHAMDEYICSTWDLPNKLYRVDYAGSRTAFSSQQGFPASDVSKVFRSGELNEFRKIIEKQFTWSCRDPLPFISLFSDKRHAENWGRKEPWHKGSEGKWALHVVDTVELRKTTHIFRLSDLVERLSLVSVSITSLRRQLSRAERQQKSKTANQESRLDADNWDYLGNYGDNDSDREMLQEKLENYNTIFEKNIENN